MYMMSKNTKPSTSKMFTFIIKPLLTIFFVISVNIQQLIPGTWTNIVKGFMVPLNVIHVNIVHQTKRVCGAHG